MKGTSFNVLCALVFSNFVPNVLIEFGLHKDFAVLYRYFIHPTVGKFDIGARSICINLKMQCK